ncbi:hypothetical protein E4U17_001482 [Claviceps sp. LM77 group G4]|nr:hypothetical protein E4U17_001482 [Claviceps sp. LM77 group G4]KAG6077180.1 hypothetical protein E4U33_001446 [Claviceps sp. LM78 group G4]KAG6077647.1 hypothetical protein E4U16_002068 [Claviceps sp. LM84 group G4]
MQDILFARYDRAKWVLGGSERIASGSLDGLARPPRLFLGKRKNPSDPPMRQLVGSGRRPVWGLKQQLAEEHKNPEKLDSLQPRRRVEG